MDFGTGALGDMACHVLHPVFKGLKLGYPTKVQGSSTLLMTDCAPNAQMVKFTFPARDNMPKVAMPEVEVYWYDGGMKPMRPKGFPQNKNLKCRWWRCHFPRNKRHIDLRMLRKKTLVTLR